MPPAYDAERLHFLGVGLEKAPAQFGFLGFQICGLQFPADVSDQAGVGRIPSLNVGGHLQFVGDAGIRFDLLHRLQRQGRLRNPRFGEERGEVSGGRGLAGGSKYFFGGPVQPEHLAGVIKHDQSVPQIA